jgi:hypothetical protein
MDQLFRLKDTVVQFLSPPSKRRRTLPATPARDDQEHRYLSPISDIQDKKTQTAALARLNQKYLSPSDTKNPRKRARPDDEEDGQTESTESGIGPDDSISQSSPREEGSSASDSEIIEEDEEEFDQEEEEEVSPDVKVQEYLDRQAELALRLEDIEKVRAAGDFHPDELFLYERLSMRSFEELLPREWQIDFPTLPKDLFTMEPEKQFINSNCVSSSRGMYCKSTGPLLANIVPRCQSIAISPHCRRSCTGPTNLWRKLRKGGCKGDPKLREVVREGWRFC